MSMNETFEVLAEIYGQIGQSNGVGRVEKVEASVALKRIEDDLKELMY